MQEIVQSIERAFCILEVLSDYNDGLGISELSSKVNLHKSTVHRILGTLTYKGYIKQNQTSNKYSLTLKLFELGNKKVEGTDLLTVSRPYLEELMKKTNEVIHLVVREGTEIVYIDKVEPKKSITMYTRIGMRKPLYCTAVGKAMLALMPENKVQDIWSNSNIKKLTKNTIIDFNELNDNFKTIRATGFAIDDQEVENGIRCVASVVKNHKSAICGAVSISGSIFSFTDDKINYFSKILIEYCNKISKELGYPIS